MTTTLDPSIHRIVVVISLLMLLLCVITKEGPPLSVINPDPSIIILIPRQLISAASALLKGSSYFYCIYMKDILVHYLPIACLSGVYYCRLCHHQIDSVLITCHLLL